jgi:hypothetical protein
MIKNASFLLAFMALLFAELVLAQSAVVTTLTGTSQVQTGTGTPRALRLGDEVRQGDTVSTGANSSAVLKFTDGQIAALTASSRMTITAYQYNAQAQSGNVLLSLITGGMRAVTGLIGRNQPSQVAYRAATATIGIRGTDTTVVTDGVQVAVVVNTGEISFTFNGRTVTVQAGQAAFAANGQITAAAAATVFNALPPALREELGTLQNMTAVIDRATLSTGSTPFSNSIGGETHPPGNPDAGGGAASSS